MADNKRISIKEIARLSGVSVASVSRILNQTGRYSKETEKKVLGIVDEYGYTVNTAAKSLRSDKTKTIGLMIPDITNEFFSKIAFYCEQFFHEKGYSLFVCSTGGSSETEFDYFKDFFSKNVDGIIAVSFLDNIPKSLVTSKIPIVALDRIPTILKEIPTVLTDEYTGGYQATELLINKGCKNIIAIIPQKTVAGIDQCNYGRAKGYIDALEKNGITFEPTNLKFMGAAENSGVEAESYIVDFINSNKPVDGIFCGSDRIALGTLHGCRRCDKDVPKDIQIIGFDNTTYSQLPTPSISTIGRSSTRLSNKACQLLLDIINGDDTMRGQSILEPIRVIERDSTK